MFRSPGVRRIAAVLFASIVLSGSAAAQDQPAAPSDLIAASQFDAREFQSIGIAPPAAPPVFAAAPTLQRRRPAALLPLYASFASLQALDAHSTRRALDRGATEANPLMRGIVGNTAGLLAVKAAGTAGVIYAGEKLWKRNKPLALLFMVATNSALAIVVQHNYRVVR